MAYTDIDDPSAHFQTATYTGNGSNGHAITNNGNSNLQPDWIWFKNRSTAQSHILQDSTRGVTKYLISNSSGAEGTDSTLLASFDSDGFTVNSANNVNNNNDLQVAWQWKANGGTTSSNTDGSITSTVQANSDAGFNIVTYTGNGSNSNFGHGMSEQPDMVFVKRRNAAGNWCVWHKDLTSSYYMQLDTTISQQTGPWDGLDPSSSVVFVYNGALVNGSGDDYVAYIFKSKQGYSKFGRYVGTGSSVNSYAFGPRIHTGFKPAWVMVKRKDATGNWVIWNNKTGPYNLNDPYIYANEASSEATSTTQGIDFLSNGFKIRNTYNDAGTGGGDYIYAAFAHNPFVSSSGVVSPAG